MRSEWTKPDLFHHHGLKLDYFHFVSTCDSLVLTVVAISEVDITAPNLFFAADGNATRRCALYLAKYVLDMRQAVVNLIQEPAKSVTPILLNS